MGWLKDRQANKHAEKMAKIEARSERVETRQETKKVAYEHGIDPNAAWAGATSSMVKSAADGLSAVYGGGLKPNASADQLNAVYGGKSGGNILVYVLIGLAALFMFKK